MLNFSQLIFTKVTKPSILFTCAFKGFLFLPYLILQTYQILILVFLIFKQKNIKNKNKKNREEWIQTLIRVTFKIKNLHLHFRCDILALKLMKNQSKKELNDTQ